MFSVSRAPTVSSTGGVGDYDDEDDDDDDDDEDDVYDPVLDVPITPPLTPPPTFDVTSATYQDQNIKKKSKHKKPKDGKMATFFIFDEDEDEEEKGEEESGASRHVSQFAGDDADFITSKRDPRWGQNHNIFMRINHKKGSGKSFYNWLSDQYQRRSLVLLSSYALSDKMFFLDSLFQKTSLRCSSELFY